MPLERSIISVQLNQGIDTKTDPKSVQGKLLTLENGIFISRNKIKKRNGNAVIGTTPTGIGRAIMPFQNELCIADGESLYSNSTSTEDIVDKGDLAAVSIGHVNFYSNSKINFGPKSAYHESGLHALAWLDYDAVVGPRTYMGFLDDDTGNTFGVRYLDPSMGGIFVRVICIGSYFVYFYKIGTDLFYCYVSVSNPTATPIKVTITNTLEATLGAFDVAVIGERCFVSWIEAGNVPRTKYLNSNLTSSGVIDLALTNPANAMTIFEDSLAHNVIVATNDVTGINYAVFNYDLTVVVKALTSISGAITGLAHMTGIATPGSSSIFNIYFDSLSASAPSWKYVTSYYLVTNYNSGTGPTIVRRSVNLCGKAFQVNGVNHILTVHSSTLQSTLFVLRDSGYVVSRLFSGTAIGPDFFAFGVLRDINKISPSVFSFAEAHKGPTGQGFSVGLVSLDFSDNSASAEIGNNLHIGSGTLNMYDGNSVVEHGFHLFPEDVTATVTGPNTGSTHSYQYSLLYSWVDAQGQTHSSAPSVPITKTTVNAISTVSADTAVTLTIPTLRLSNKQIIGIQIYRTIDNGTVFYNVNESFIANDATADTISYTDNSTDAEIQGLRQLYTTGGVVENIGPDAIGFMTIFQNRLVATDALNPLQIWYSKQVEVGGPVEFSDFFTIQVDPRGGPITALSTLDDKLIIYKRNSIFFMVGQGPDSAGGNNDFSRPQELTTDNGCINQNSIVVTPNGLMYQSTKGIYLLNRSLQVQYIGADVETYNSYTIVSADLIPNTNQVRFTTTAGLVLVFDYYYGQWSVFTGINAVDTCLFNDKFTYIQSDGAFLQETPGLFSDNGNYIRLKLSTAWIQMAGLQGFQRARRLMLLGDYIAPHKLLSSIAYDFNPNNTQDSIIDAGDLLGNIKYGEDTPYGNESQYGGEYPLYQWRIHLVRQKCQAIQLTLQDMPESDGATTEGMSLSAIALEIGVKRGLNKLPATRSFG